MTIGTRSLAHVRPGFTFALFVGVFGLSGCKPDCHPKYRLEGGNCILIHDDAAGSGGVGAISSGASESAGATSGPSGSVMIGNATAGIGGTGTVIAGQRAMQMPGSNSSAGTPAGAVGGSSAAAGGRANVAGCGNSIVDPGETCDPVDTCPTAITCKSSDPCLAAQLIGDASTCTAKCELTEISACSSGDGCCPKGCTASKDNDCSQSCGDGELAKSETCEPMSSQYPCPDSCDDKNPCTSDLKTGSPDQCNVKCTNMPITARIAGDGCCPQGADASTDKDCMSVCGNGVKEPGELCDGNCPASCDDRDECTIDEQTGSAATCDIQCTHTDSSSAACLCGNGRKDANETCDNSSSTRCSTCVKTDSCTQVMTSGSAATCDLQCTMVPIAAPRNNDGCCPSSANASNDNDCKPVCGNGVVEVGEKCDGNCPTSCSDSTDLCAQETRIGNGCSVQCSSTKVSYCGTYTACKSNSDCASGFNCSGLGVCIASNTCDDSTPCPIVPGVTARCISGGYCVAGCTSNNDCPPHTTCAPAPADSTVHFCRGN